MPSSVGGRNALSAAVVAGLMVLSVIALWVVARSAPSSAVGETGGVPRAPITLSGGCQNFGDYWLNGTTVDIEAATLEGFTNCRQGEDGRWYGWTELPESGDDSAPTLSDEDRVAAEELKTRILEDIDALRARISAELQTELDMVFSESQNPVIGQIREGASLSNVRTRYARLINAFALNPEREALAGYAGWAMEQRINAYGVFRRACLDEGTGYLRQPCVGMEDNLSIRYAPWYWELRNPLLLEAYVGSLFAEEAEPA